MLHTLNKAWATILINQLLDNKKQTIMFVAKNKKEADYYADLFRGNVKILKKENPENDDIHGTLWTEVIKNEVNTETQTLTSNYNKEMANSFNLQIFIVTEEGLCSGLWNDVFDVLGQVDDILISHKIHDMMLKDFLGRHCKRKCC
jgi:hypothetical protein